MDCGSTLYEWAASRSVVDWHKIWRCAAHAACWAPYKHGQKVRFKQECVVCCMVPELRSYAEQHQQLHQ